MTEREREKRLDFFFFTFHFGFILVLILQPKKGKEKKKGNALDINCIRDAGVTVSVHFSSSEGMKFHSALAHPSDVGYSR